MPPPTDPGQFIHRLTYSEPVTADAPDAVGQPVVTWVDRFTIWAPRLAPLNARETYYASQTHASTTHNVTCRYRPGIKPTGRFVMGARIFNITGVLDWEERRVELSISVEEQTPSEA